MEPPRMTGLPRVQSTIRRRPVWDRVLLGGIESMTAWLMSGAEVTEDDLRDMRALRARLRGFENALDARERAAGIVMEEDDE
jgi:hypothetical protein